MHFLSWSNNYYKYEDRDKKIPVLLQYLNSYRTTATVGLATTIEIIIAKVIGTDFAQKYFIPTVITSISFLIVFIFAYRKQSILIQKRISSKGRRK